MARAGVVEDDGLLAPANAFAAIAKAVVALVMFAVAFVLFLIAPLALIVAVCLGLIVQDRWRRRQPARQLKAVPARTARGPVDTVGAGYRFGGQIEGNE